MSSPIVTVIVPGRDVGAFAAAALDSLRAQQFDRWRAILVDDGSIDETSRIFSDAATADDRFTLIRHDTARGLGAARNVALDRVETPFVGFLDADDVMLPRALTSLIGALEHSGSDIAVGAYVRLRPDADGEYTPGIVQPWVSAATDPARSGATLADHPDVSGNIVAWSKVSRIELWRRGGIRFTEDRAYEDQEVAQLLYTKARGIDVIPDVVVHWRERADGSSITQHKAALPVLHDYLAGLRGGIAVLDAGGHRAAAACRVRLILDMDTPPLVRIAEAHVDDAYRREVGAFVRELGARAEREQLVLDAASAPLLSAATLW